MKVLMLGWEFPPAKLGGLGVACYNFVRELNRLNVTVYYVMPSFPEELKEELFRLIQREFIPGKFFLFSSNIQMNPYKIYGQVLPSYSPNSIEKYAEFALKVAEGLDFDVIHAHDWMTYLAGIKLKEKFGKPLIVHVHSTLYDRAGGNLPKIYDYYIEKMGFEKADLIIANSKRVKDIIVKYYGIDPKKIIVIYNAFSVRPGFKKLLGEKLKKKFKIVLFLGRLTMFKGPDWFLKAAKKVLEYEKNVMFIVGGTGEMMPQLVKLAADLGISDHVLFTGYLRDEEVDMLYELADVYVLPSISEPFGITILEALYHNTPVITSKTVGVGEVLNHIFKVDFWDTEEMANKIIALLRYPTLRKIIATNGKREMMEKLSWQKSAKELLKAYYLVTKK